MFIHTIVPCTFLTVIGSPDEQPVTMTAELSQLVQGLIKQVSCETIVNKFDELIPIKDWQVRSCLICC